MEQSIACGSRGILSRLVEMTADGFARNYVFWISALIERRYSRADQLQSGQAYLS